MSALKQNISTTFRLVLDDIRSHKISLLVLAAVLIILDQIWLFLGEGISGAIFIPLLIFQILVTVLTICRWHQICLKDHNNAKKTFLHFDEFAYIARLIMFAILLIFCLIVTFLPTVFILQLSSTLIKIVLAIPLIAYTYFIGLGANSFLWRFAVSLPHIAIGKDDHPNLEIHSNFQAHHHFLMLSMIIGTIWALKIWLIPILDQSRAPIIGSLFLAFSSIITASLLNAVYRQYTR